MEVALVVENLLYGVLVGHLDLLSLHFAISANSLNFKLVFCIFQVITDKHFWVPTGLLPVFQVGTLVVHLQKIQIEAFGIEFDWLWLTSWDLDMKNDPFSL